MTFQQKWGKSHSSTSFPPVPGSQLLRSACCPGLCLGCAFSQQQLCLAFFTWLRRPRKWVWPPQPCPVSLGSQECTDLFSVATLDFVFLIRKLACCLFLCNWGPLFLRLVSLLFSNTTSNYPNISIASSLKSLVSDLASYSENEKMNWSHMHPF